MEKAENQSNAKEKCDISKYDLTEEQYHNCIRKAELAIFMNAEKSFNPLSVFIVAQPGAGKTGLRAYIEHEYSERNFIEINPDDVAIYHEYYEKIVQEHPTEQYQILDRFVRPALDTYLRKKAVFLRTNIIQEGTLASTQGYIDILNFQKNGGVEYIGEVQSDGKRSPINVQGGYDVDINILAVHRFESLLSSYEREQEYIEFGLPPRAVTEQNHDRAYEKMLETIKIIEQKQLYDRIRVFRRGEQQNEPQKVFQTGSRKYHSVLEAILEERKNNLNQLIKKPEDYLGRIEKLEEKIALNPNKRNARVQQEKLGNLKHQFIYELTQRKEQNQK